MLFWVAPCQTAWSWSQSSQFQELGIPDSELLTNPLVRLWTISRHFSESIKTCHCMVIHLTHNPCIKIPECTWPNIDCIIKSHIATDGQIYWKWLFSSFTLLSVKTKTPIYGNDKKDIMTEYNLSRTKAESPVRCIVNTLCFIWVTPGPRWREMSRSWQMPWRPRDSVTGSWRHGWWWQTPGSPRDASFHELSPSSRCIMVQKPLLSHDAQISASPLEDLCTK